MEKERISITISKEVLKRIEEDKDCIDTFAGMRSPMIEQILRKHYGLGNMFKEVKEI